MIQKIKGKEVVFFTATLSVGLYYLPLDRYSHPTLVLAITWMGGDKWHETSSTFASYRFFTALLCWAIELTNPRSPIERFAD